jgi:hypothetical protein
VETETRSDRIIVGRLHQTQEFTALIRLLNGPLQETFRGDLRNAQNQEDAAKACFRWQAYQQVLGLIQETVEKGDR